MRKKTKTTLITYIVCLVFAGIFAGSIFFSRDWSADMRENYKNLSDAFSVPGVLLLSVATIIWLSGEGIFDGVGFVVGKAFRSLIPFARTRELKGETYQEYKERRHPATPSKGEDSVNIKLHILLSGVLFILISVVFVFLYYA